jgi:hypothetical protein
MSKLGINTGTSPDSGTGDSLLLGGIKINNNFDEIYNSIGDGFNINIGIGKTLLSTTLTGNVGIGSTIPTSKLDVSGNGKFTGIVTATTFSGQVNVGVGTIINLTGTAGTITTLVTTNLVGTALSASGISTFRNGPVFIGAATSTGTESQRLQVTGNAYISGNLGIGTTTPSSTFSVVGGAFITGIVTCKNLSSSSDQTLKNNIEKLSDSIEIIKQINPVSFNWKDTGEKSYGVIAQELESVLPELIREMDGKKTVDYIPLIAFLIDALKNIHNNNNIIISDSGVKFKLIVDEDGNLSTVPL